MVAEVVESQPSEALVSSWQPVQPNFQKHGVIDLEALGALLGGQLESDVIRGGYPAEVAPADVLAVQEQVGALKKLDEAPPDELHDTRQIKVDAHSEQASDGASEPEVLLESAPCGLPAEPLLMTFASRAPLRLLTELAADEPVDEAGEPAADSPPAEAAADELVIKEAVPSATNGEDAHTPATSSQTPAIVEERCPKKKPLFNASHTSYECVESAAAARGWRVVKQEERAGACNVHWIDDSAIGDWLRRIEPWMRVNHFPGMNNALARKSRLARNMSRMMRSFPVEYRFIPPTWVLPDDIGDLTKRFDSAGETKAIYIVKPDHLCQGKGIFLTTDVERLKKVAADMREKDQAAVVQRYITRPMLIDGLKFDLRLYFLVTGVLGTDGVLEPRYFLFRDGLVRLCTTPYEAPTPENFDNRCLHLTNYAINKNSKNFQQGEDVDDGTGSKRSLKWFLNYIEAEFGEKERRKLWHKLMGVCNKTLLTVHSTLEGEYFSTFPKDLTGGLGACRCFEILGVDVMLDAKRKPYLIEVNHLPSFTCDSPLDEDIKRRLVDQTMDLTCSSISFKDKKSYEQLVRDRREATAAAAATSGAVTEPQLVPASYQVESLLELPEYKDFERAYPAPASAPKLAASCDAILARVREIFRPVQAVRRPRASQDGSESCQTGAPSATAATTGAPSAKQRPPPLPPRAAPSVANPPSSNSAPSRPPPRPMAESVASATVPASLRRMAAAMAQAGGEAGSRGPSPTRKRSRSAPGPPRCALPPIQRFSSPRLARHLSSTPEGSEPDREPSLVRGGGGGGMVRVPSRQRVFLPLKSAQILL